MGFYSEVDTTTKNRLKGKSEDEESLMLTAKKRQCDLRESQRDASELAQIQLQIEQVQKAKGKHQQGILMLTIEYVVSLASGSN
jgi:hypothetical protein